jgi:hypothetical protein
VWRNPVDGGTQREDGGQFVFVSGRPYRYEHDPMRADTDFILRELFGEPYMVTAVENEPGAPAPLRLAQNFPNPFNPETTIRFDLPRAMSVRLAVYDVQGREVARIADGSLPAGTHAVKWDGLDRGGHRVASGVYWYRLEAGEISLSRKMVLLK